MTTRSMTCFTLTCDGREDCDPWEEGPYHFDTAEAAIEYARSEEWLIIGDRAICPDCSDRADCAATGHQYGAWRANEWPEFAITFRSRFCEHCPRIDYDPPFRELSLLIHAARQLEGTDPE
jgi:hypothetical protein